MSAMANVVAKNSRPYQVTRRAALVYDGTGPNPTAAPVETVQTVRLALQRQPPTGLVRDIDGDESGGQARVWVTDAALAAVGWTDLQIAPAEDADGPPGDLIAWEGRTWEITEFQGWDVFFGRAAEWQRYKATDRGPA